MYSYRNATEKAIENMNNRILNFLKGMAKDSNGEFPELTESEIANLGEGLVSDYEASLKEPYVSISCGGEKIVKNGVCIDSSASDCIAVNEMKDNYEGDKPSKVKSFSTKQIKVPILIKQYLLSVCIKSESP